MRLVSSLDARFRLWENIINCHVESNPWQKNGFSNWHLMSSYYWQIVMTLHSITLDSSRTPLSIRRSNRIINFELDLLASY